MPLAPLTGADVEVSDPDGVFGWCVRDFNDGPLEFLVRFDVALFDVAGVLRVVAGAVLLPASGEGAVIGPVGAVVAPGVGERVVAPLGAC